jgi:excisionase family DNA binding protein
MRRMNNSEFCRVSGLAKRLGVSRGYIYKLKSEGRMPGVIRLGHVLLIRRDAVEKMLAQGLAR